MNPRNHSVRHNIIGPFRRGGFTLIEVLLAAVAGAMILAATYTIFSGAIHLRDSATERTAEARLYSRAAQVIRTDIENGFLSNGPSGPCLEGSATGQSSRFPGFLRFTTTTGEATNGEVGSDLQEVEYYIIEDESSTNREAGILVRAIRRNLLSELEETAEEQEILQGVSGFEVSFYDGQSWVDMWDASGDEMTTPTGVRMVITRPADPLSRTSSPPLEIIAPWGSAPPEPEGDQG